jgi:hypothetical protein
VATVPQVIYEHEEPRRNDTDREKLLIHPPELSGNPTSSNPVAKQEEMEKETILCYKVSFHTSKGSLTCHKILRNGANSFTSLRRRVCCGFLLPSAGFEPINLESNGMHANYYTNIPLRMTADFY